MKVTNHFYKDEPLYHLHRWLYFSERLSEQCEGWLSADEGNKNIEKRIRDHKKII